ncbi:glycoside hydrolase family 3 protein [Deinococcus sp. Arct2-2]|uniref:glycoside hydrolase family 3 N-terminal domain-containing protein n=1 Tax=Deinococcus sp. Arct2-2 TaxID=2568653 RepID=UPI0010A4CFF5|nr:glycoside hydrolase family 3 protein [Deinococcus sp. Arct2-2]THF71658.1 glycoside hydrolase family 3 protein [Deinococcus sp. Arct2-2]
MTLALNRTLIIDLPGPDLTPEQAQFLARHSFGGVCLFARNFSTPQRTAQLVRDIRDALGHDALIATDQEGGAVLRRLDRPLAPTPQALGVIGSEEAAREAGRIAARGLIELGINWNYAPSLDVNVNPLNPVIGERAFGSDPELVARLGVAWALGSEEEGVLSAVKHFPGHGDTTQDSHLTLPTVTKSRAELEQTEWRPFRAAVAAGVGSIMTAHIVYPALDAVQPATLSPAFLTKLLRTDWHYNGVVVTDASDMHAIADRHPHGEAAPLALLAGADAVLSCGHGDLTTHAEHAAALHRAVHEGRLSPERVAQAIGRLERAAARFPGMPRPYSQSQQLADQSQIETWAAQSLSFSGQWPTLDPTAPLLLIVPETSDLGGPYGDAPSGAALAEVLRPHFPALQVALLRDDSAEALALLALFPTVPVLFATTNRWRLSPLQTEVVRALHQREQVLHLALWNPEHAAALPFPALVSHGFRPANFSAVAQVLVQRHP